MPFVPVLDTAKVCLRFSKAGQQVCNVLHVEADTAIDNTVLNQIGSIVTTWATTQYLNHLSSDMTLEAVEVTDLTTAGGLGIVYTTGLPQTGGDTSGALPNNVAVAVKLATGLTGRSHRGRTFVPGIAAGALTADKQHINSTLQGILISAFDALISDLIAEGLTLVVTSLVSGGVPRTAGVNTPVLAPFVNTTLDSQRRRLPERGA